jgi:ribonuclease HII
MSAAGGRGGGGKAVAGPRRARGRRSDPFRFDRSRLELAGGEASLLAGADEVGRGCLAGPLVVAAVVLDYRSDPARRLKGMSDSKALSREAREDLYGRILVHAREVSVLSVAPGRIDEDGLHRSNLRALGQVLASLSGYHLALVDGFDLGLPQLSAERLSDGDWRSAAVASASIVAKVTRDRLMAQLDASYPLYGFARHVGYATRDHQEALRSHGPCPLHRRSFALVRTLSDGGSAGSLASLETPVGDAACLPPAQTCIELVAEDLRPERPAGENRRP